MFPFSFSMNNGRTEGTKKTPADAAAEAREEPIWLNSRQVNRVRRIGAFSRQHPKKLPWDEAVATELVLCLPVKVEPHYELVTLVKSTEGRRQLCPVMSGIGSGSRCLTGLGITAPLQMAPIFATTAEKVGKSNIFIGGATRSGGTSIRSAAQRRREGEGLSPGHETGTGPVVGAT